MVTRTLAGKRALVTGGARRIGRAIALALAEAGASVAITYREHGEDAETTLRDLAARDVDAMALRCDVRDPVSVREAVAEVVAEFDGLDLLINNAAIYTEVALTEISLEQWDEMFATNARGPFLVSQAAYPHLKAVKGCIVHIGSLGGMLPWATHGHYCASKAALHMLSQTMAKAWAPEISVNCVAPGMIQQGEKNELDDWQRLAAKTPMKRNGMAEDVAAAVLFFATAPSFITGQLLAVDGGLGLS